MEPDITMTKHYAKNIQNILKFNEYRILCLQTKLLYFRYVYFQIASFNRSHILHVKENQCLRKCLQKN